MKLSIWQQFSSNHSSHFDIIASFESAAWANTVADELTNLVLESYFVQQITDIESGDDAYFIEKAHEARYGGHIGAAKWLLDVQHAKRVVQVMDNLILLADEPGYCNTLSATGFIGILDYMGGTAFSMMEAGRHDTFVNIRAIAPDEQTIESLKQADSIKRTSSGDIIYQIPMKRQAQLPAPDEIDTDTHQITYQKLYMWRFRELFNWMYFLKFNNCSQIEVQFIEELHKGDSQRTSEWINFDGIENVKPIWSPRNTREQGRWRDYHHSIIATFNKAEDAETVASNIREMLGEISEWVDANLDEANTISRAYWETLSPPEQALAQKHKIKWEHSILEWLIDAKNEGYLFDTVTTIDNHVMMRNRHASGYGIYPFDSIIKQSKPLAVYEPQYAHSELVFTIRFTGNRHTIKHVFTALVYQDKYRLRSWSSRYKSMGNRRNPTSGDMQEALNYHQRYMQTVQELESEYVRSKDNDFRDELIQFVTANPIVQMSKWASAWHHANDMNFTYNEVHLVDNEIVLGGVQFPQARTYKGLKALMTWFGTATFEITSSDAKR